MKPFAQKAFRCLLVAFLILSTFPALLPEDTNGDRRIALDDAIENVKKLVDAAAPDASMAGPLAHAVTSLEAVAGMAASIQAEPEAAFSSTGSGHLTALRTLTEPIAPHRAERLSPCPATSYRSLSEKPHHRPPRIG